MARMIRKQIYIEERQEESLKARATAEGVSESELIRRALDHVIEEQEEEERRKRAWEDFEAVVRERMAMDVPQTGRSWTRDELYEERVGRFSR